MEADVHDWGTHPYATANENSASITLDYTYTVHRRKAFLRNGKTCTNIELRGRRRPARTNKYTTEGA